MEGLFAREPSDNFKVEVQVQVKRDPARSSSFNYPNKGSQENLLR